ncbi:MAG: WD40 repeat domain-containing protein [Planctomycetota bacterium]
MLRAALALVVMVSLASAEPEGQRIRALIALLDSEETAERDAAEKELEAIGVPALPFLRQAVKDGSPEVRARASVLAGSLGVREVLRRPDNKYLADRWSYLGDEDPVRRYGFLRHFSQSGKATAAHGDALIEILQLPTSQRDAATSREALAWLTSPRLMEFLRVAPHLGPGNASALDYLRKVLVGRVTCEGDAGQLLAVLEAPPMGLNNDPSTVLEALDFLCDQAGLAWRPDDASDTIRIATPEACDVGRVAEWKRLRDDQVALSQIGLAPPPDAARLSADDLEKWLGELASKDARHSRAARALLREAEGDLAAEIGRRAAVPEATQELRLLAAAMALRVHGRIAFVSDRGGDYGVWTARPDGSSAKRLDFKLDNPGPLLGGSSARVVFKSWGKNFAVIAPDRPEDSRRFKCWGFERIVASPEVRRIAIDDGSTIRILDAGTGEEVAALKQSSLSDLAWSGDGSTLAWLGRGEMEGVRAWGGDPGTERLVTKTLDYGFGLRWSPDGASLAWIERRSEKEPDPVTSWQVRSVSVGSGETRWLSRPCAQLGCPAWSPDGASLAWVRSDDRDDEPGPIRLDILTIRENRIRTLDLVDSGAFRGTMSADWSPDGAFVAVPFEGLSLSVVEVATGKVTPLEPIQPSAVGIRWICGTHDFLDTRSGDIFLRFIDGSSWSIFESSGTVVSPVSLLPPR